MAHVYKFQSCGTDAEVFLRSLATDDPMPVCGLLGGTKEAPLPIESLGKGFAVQEDNVMPEFNIPVSFTRDQFSDNIQRMLDYLIVDMEKKGFKIDIAPAMFFHPSQLQTHQAATFGCEPDFCVYTRTPNEIDRSALGPAFQGLRTAAAHVHIGFTIDGKQPEEFEITKIEPVVKAMDFAVGLPSIVLDSDTLRKKLYGKAGAFRPKPYGIEYRVASNFWIEDHNLREWIFDCSKWAVDYAPTVASFMEEKSYIRGITEAINGTPGKDLRSASALYDHMVQNLNLPSPNQTVYNEIRRMK